MRLLGKVAIGGTLASAATATWLVTAGVFATSATLVALDPIAPRAQAHPQALAPFDSCTALLDWYVSSGVTDVGPYGWNQIVHAVGPWFEDGFARLDQVSGQRAPMASASGTNTQEAAADEPDVAKTDGTLLARVVDDNTLVLDDVSGADPRTLARLRLPSYGYESELLLAGEHVLITQQVYNEPKATARTSTSASSIVFSPGQMITRVIDVDISDPAHPRMLSRDRYSGRLLAARQYGDTIRVVTATERPELDWTYPGRGVSRREATRKNRAAVRATSISDWLPTVVRNGQPRTLLDCAEVLHPKEQVGNDTVVVTTFASTNSDQRSAIGITAGGGIAYSSGDRLYVATSANPGQWIDTPIRNSSARTTSIHAFDLTGPTRYLGSGEVTGQVRDRWSLDEYAGHLRVAWTRTNQKGRTRNGITVLTERDGDLVPAATIEDLGLGEDLQSVRWFDDLAILVTFRQVDPLYTVDLTDQEHPRVLGTLKIPGYSGYLHPIGDDLILGLGMAGNAAGNISGAQAAVFDISDPSQPVRLSQQALGRDTYLSAVDDPRAFTWAASARTGVTPLTDWRADSNRMIALEVDDDGMVHSRTLTTLNTDWQARSFALPDGRFVILDRHRVRLINP